MPLNQSRSGFDLANLDAGSSHYCKSEMEQYKHALWKEHLLSCADAKLWYLICLSDMSDVDFSIENHKLLFPRASKRSTDTQIMDLIHGHSLSFGSFKHSIGRRSHPYCETCRGELEDNNYHQLMICPRFNSVFRNDLSNLCTSPDAEIGIFLSIVFNASKEQVNSFRNMAQIIINLQQK